MTRRPRKTVSSAQPPNPALIPTTETLIVGGSGGPTAEPAPPTVPPARKKNTKVPFGSYLDPDLQRAFKAHCVLSGIEMQDGLEQAIRQYLGLAPEQAVS
ncbi:hypothetical protein [Streptomyces sp. NBC_01565]|uniref:hypothetical protein n=1 Tax=Streptomyces sp. NBC_01565 TaxID=2975881 RepID=UPI002254CAAF|nr:hypothetical protein [Streptomyces sp. NBC_01565]MCX4547246.1 hypothetical protein [Streptomyces sp. NBC_01565]